MHSTDSPEQIQTSACPFPAIAWIDNPLRGAELTGIVNVNGWAFNEDIGIESITLLIDSEVIGRVDYGGQRTDVVAAMEVQSDPNSPNIGYDYSFDSSQLNNGSHQLEIEIRNHLGITQRFGERAIEVNN